MLQPKEFWISIDPGLRSCGYAVWWGDELDTAELITNGEKRDCKDIPKLISSMVETALVNHSGCLDKVVIEFPQTYGGRAARGDTNDLLHIAAVVGGIVALFSRVMIVKPHEWKGSAPKEVTTARTKKILSSTELSRIKLPKAKSLQHNVWDAIGIGLWSLGRRSFIK